MSPVSNSCYDPELAAAIAAMPAVDMADPVGTRNQLRGQRSAGEEADQLLKNADYVVSELAVPGSDNTHDIPVRVYSRSSSTLAPCILFMHGGAFAFGDLDNEHIKAARLAVDCDATVVSVDYRLAPEHRYPAGLDDCDHVLRWLVANADELAIDTTRVALAGTSAGGCLAAGLALRNRDTQGPPIVFQLLTYPCLDASMSSPSAHACIDTPGWDRPSNEQMWPHYLPVGQDAVSAYASPALAEDLGGLPPALILTAEFDPLRDEAVAYAQRLAAASVSVHLIQTARTFHGFETAAYAAKVTQLAIAQQTAVLRSVLQHSGEGGAA